MNRKSYMGMRSGFQDGLQEPLENLQINTNVDYVRDLEAKGVGHAVGMAVNIIKNVARGGSFFDAKSAGYAVNLVARAYESRFPPDEGMTLRFIRAMNGLYQRLEKTRENTAIQEMQSCVSTVLDNYIGRARERKIGFMAGYERGRSTGLLPPELGSLTANNADSTAYLAKLNPEERGEIVGSAIGYLEGAARAQITGRHVDVAPEVEELFEINGLMYEDLRIAEFSRKLAKKRLNQLRSTVSKV